MSASREKKERRDISAQGMTERQKREQELAAKAKTRAILYTVGGGILAVLILALLVWNSGMFQRNSTALTVKGKNYSPADVSYFYYQTLNNAWYNEQYMASLYEMYGLEYTAAFDPAKDLNEQWVDAEQTQSYHDYFIASAKEALSQTAALYDAAKAEGFTMSQEDKDAMNSSIESIRTQASEAGYSTEAYIKAVYGKYVTEAIYRRNLEISAIASAYYAAKTEEMGEYTDAEMDAYAAANPRYLESYSYQRCFINGVAPAPTDDNGEALLDDDGNAIAATEEEQAAAMATAKASAEAMVAAVRAGGDFAELAPEYVAEVDALAYAQDGYTNGHTLGNDLTSTTYGDWLTDPERKAGEVELFEAAGSGYYVVQYDSHAIDNTETVDFRHILFMAEQDEGAEEPTQAQMDAARVKAQEALDTWKAGEEPTEATFGTLADELTEDSGSKGKGGLYEKVQKGTMVAGIDSWIFDAARQSGDTTLAENFGPGYYGWHVVYFQKHNIPAWRSVAKTQMLDEDTNAWMETIEAGYEATEGAGMKYVP